MTTYGRFLEVPEVPRMKSLLLWFVIYVYVRPGVVAEIELYPDVTSDDYPLDELSLILQAQQRRQSLLQQRQRQLAEAEEEFGAQEMEAAAEAAAATAAAAAAAAAEAASEHGRTPPQRLPFEQQWAALPPSSVRGGPQRMSAEALGPDSLAGFQPGSGVAQEPAFSYRELAGQAADGEAAPFAVSPKDPRFYEDSPSQVAELAGSDVYRSRDYGFRGSGTEEGAGAGDVDATADNNVWAERSGGFAQQPAPPVAQLAHFPRTSGQQPDQAQRGGAKAAGSSGSGPTSGAKKTGMEPVAAAASDAFDGLGRPPPPSGAAVPSQAMDREAPSGAGEGPPRAAASAGTAVRPAAPDVGSVGGPPSASDVAARAKAGADAAARAYQSARGYKGQPENEDDDEAAMQSSGVHSDFMSGQIKQKHMAVDNSDVYFIAIVAGCCAAAAVGIIGVGISWYRRRRRQSRDQERDGHWAHLAPTTLHYQHGSTAFKAMPLSHMHPMSSSDLSYDDLRRSTVAVCGSSDWRRDSDFKINPDPLNHVGGHDDRLQKNAKAAADVEYPAYGVTGPKQDISPTSGDRRLAQSAQMYHYQHQKQQIIAMESTPPDSREVATEVTGYPDWRCDMLPRPAPRTGGSSRSQVTPKASQRGFSDRMFQDFNPMDEPGTSQEKERNVVIPWEHLPGATREADDEGVSAYEEEETSEERKRSSIMESSRTRSTSLDRKTSLVKSPSGSPTRSNVALAAQKLNSVRGPAHMRRVIKGMNYSPKPRSSSLPEEIDRLSRTYSVPRNLSRSSEMKDLELQSTDHSKRKSEIQKVIRKSIPSATQRLEDSTRRAVEYLEERHKSTMAAAESKVRRPQPPEPAKPPERVTRRRRPQSPTHKQNKNEPKR